MSSNPPKVTVLALAYNHSQYLTETLDSIRRQTFQDFELLVSDDASQDNSAALIQQWNAKHQRANQLFLHDKNIGLCPTLNELLSHARGEYLQFIACDDHLLPRSLEQRVQALDQYGPETAAVYSDALRIDENGAAIPKTFLQRFLKKKPIPTGDLYSQLLLGNFLPGMSVLMRRELVEEVGGFDSSLAFEDWDLWQRLTRKYEFAYFDRPTVQYRIHSGNLHKTMPNQSRQFYRILAKHRDEFRARLRILRLLVRSPEEFALDSAEIKDFLSWADEYRETRWFRQWYFGASELRQATVAQIVETGEGVTRPFSATSITDRIRRAA
jgi:glycosyltransferase involved in cell wall biosynthesis